MKKIRNDSVLEIWSGAYINDATTRLPEDISAEIVQISLGNEEGCYIVEVVKHHENASSCNKEDVKENINDHVIGIDLALSDVHKQQIINAIYLMEGIPLRNLEDTDDMKKIKGENKK